MAIQGHTILELAREKKVNNRIKREVVKRVEKINHITEWGDKFMNEGNFLMMASPSKIMPYNQWFNGCLLTDKVNPNGDDVSGYLGLIASDAEIVAQCSNDAYNGTNTKRGSYNTHESGIITGGYRHVFDWTTSQGNASTIASACLTRAMIGAVDLSTSSSTTPNTSVNEQIGHAAGVEGADNNLLGACIIDYEKERAYRVDYSNGTISVYEYFVNTSSIHLLGSYNDGYLIAEHTISQTVNYFSVSSASASYTGDKIHLITANGNKVYDYAINTTSWACTATEHTYSGISIAGIVASNLQKDSFPIIGNYVYLVTSGGTKIAKCNLLGNNDADVTEVSIPFANTDFNGASIVLPNGDWYKVGRYGDYGEALYYHNGHYYRSYMRKFGGYGCDLYGINGNDYGSVIYCSRYYDTYHYFDLASLFPYVSTVNNLDEAVTKTADLTMKLTYEITETAPT